MTPPDLKIVTTGLSFPEGPIAMADGSVILVEIRAQKLPRVAPDGTKSTVAEMPGGPNGAALGPDGHVYVCNNGGFSWMDDPKFGTRPTGQAADYSGGRIERVEIATGRVETLYTSCDGHPLKGPNDLVFDAHGGFYFTDLGKTRHREIDRGGVYYAKADGSAIKQVAGPTLTANGCALSPDGTRCISSRLNRLGCGRWISCRPAWCGANHGRARMAAGSSPRSEARSSASTRWLWTRRATPVSRP